MKIIERYEGELKAGDWLILPELGTITEIIEVEEEGTYLYSPLPWAHTKDEDEQLEHWETSANCGDPEFSGGLYWQVAEATAEEREAIKNACDQYWEAYKNIYRSLSKEELETEHRYRNRVNELIPAELRIDWLLGEN